MRLPLLEQHERVLGPPLPPAVDVGCAEPHLSGAFESPARAHRVGAATTGIDRDRPERVRPAELKVGHHGEVDLDVVNSPVGVVEEDQRARTERFCSSDIRQSQIVVVVVDTLSSSGR